MCRKETLIHCQKNCKHILWKSVWKIPLSYNSTIQLLCIIHRTLAIPTRLHNQERREGVENQKGQFQEKRCFQDMAGQFHKLTNSRYEFIKSSKTKIPAKVAEMLMKCHPQMKSNGYLGREMYFSLEIQPICQYLTLHPCT